MALTKTAARRVLARGVRRLRHGRPRLGIVVVAIEADATRLKATLSAVRDQPSPAIEIVVVGSGASFEVARGAAQDDTRARFLEAGSVSAARRLGVRRTRASHVLIAGPGDLYVPGALAELAAEVGTDVVWLSGSAGFETVAAQPPQPTGHGADLAQVPGAAFSPYLGRLVLRRPVAAAALSQADDDPEGRLVALRLLRSGFTVVSGAYRDGRGAASGPFTVRVDPFPGLEAHVARDRTTLELVADLPAARAARAAGAIAGLRPFLEAAERADDAGWATLVDTLGSLRSEADLGAVDVVGRVLALLAADGRRNEVTALAARFRDEFPTVRRDGRVYADLAVAAGTLPEEAFEVGAEESCLVAQARRLVVADGVVRLELLVGIRHLSQARTDVVRVRLADRDLTTSTGSGAAVTRWMGEKEHDHDAGLVQVEIPVEDLTGAQPIEVIWSAGDLERRGFVTTVDQQGSAARSWAAQERSVRLRTRPGGVAVVVGPPEAPPAGSLLGIEVTDESLLLRVGGGVDRVVLAGEGRRVAGVPGGAGEWTVALSDDAWGLGSSPLRTGTYRLPGLVAHPDVVDLLPTDLRTARHRVQLLRGAGDGVVVRLDPPLGDDEFGPRAQRLLQATYAASTEPLDPDLVYFQAFTGQWACDNSLAIQAELARRRPDLDMRWVVADSAASVPPGARPVLFRSREWYDVMTRASYLVTNIELEDWYRRRPGQQVLQTFHGYPSKAMGLGLWRPRGMTPTQIESQLDHTSRVWNTLVTPAPEMEQYYRRDYAYDGRIISTGYPRNDVLVDERSAELRASTRQRLGIREDQHAILYAPTWRDDLATNFRAAEAVHHLDVQQASAALGDRYVLLMRGHRFHAPGAGSGSRVLDVTGYPDINHLIAASDAAVLDYSSLRFDFALTGRPMVFLVPDLETYGSSTRGFLWDYRETAPGPLVATTAEVVAALADLEALDARWGADVAAFNARYNSLHDGHAAERVVTEFFADLV